MLTATLDNQGPLIANMNSKFAKKNLRSKEKVPVFSPGVKYGGKNASTRGSSHNYKSIPTRLAKRMTC